LTDVPVLSFSGISTESETRFRVAINALVVAGWTGRDAAIVETHIRELEALGVQRPVAMPTFYRVAARRLTTAKQIEVSGGDSSGEVEFILIQAEDSLWVGVGSDHTDRRVEAYNVTVSKQMCDKPVAPALWPYAEVQGHWDKLVLRSFAITDGQKTLYQEGTVEAMLPPGELIARYTDGGVSLAAGTVMFGGTLPVIGNVRSGESFAFELEDPIHRRRLTHAYRVVPLPVAG
jgi:hypothetical protein